MTEKKDDCVVKAVTPDSGNLSSFPGPGVSLALCKRFNLSPCFFLFFFFFFLYHRGVITLQIVLRINALTLLVHWSSGKRTYKRFSSPSLTCYKRLFDYPQNKWSVHTLCLERWGGTGSARAGLCKQVLHPGSVPNFQSRGVANDTYQLRGGWGFCYMNIAWSYCTAFFLWEGW